MLLFSEGKNPFLFPHPILGVCLDQLIDSALKYTKNLKNVTYLHDNIAETVAAPPQKGMYDYRKRQRNTESEFNNKICNTNKCQHQ